MLVFALMASATVLLTSMPATALSALTDKNISGTIYDQASQPIAGSTVTVEIWGGYWPDTTILRFTYTDLADAWGHYEVVVNANYWDPHNTIKVTAAFGADQKTSSVEADGVQYQTVDVSLAIMIPEFGMIVAPWVIVLGSLASVLILAVTRRRNQVTE